MPMFNTKTQRINFSGEAASRKQMRDAELDRIEKNKLLPTISLKGFWFRPQYNFHDSININGPLCPKSITKDRVCLAPLSGDNPQSLKATCEVCGSTFTMPHSFDNYRGIAHKAYEGFINSQAELVTLDVPYDAVKAEAEDNTRYVKVVWSQKDGRNQAIIYLIGKDDKGDKTHIFADLDREEVRYDPGDIPPGNVLAKIKAEFRGTKVSIDYKEEKN